MQTDILKHQDRPGWTKETETPGREIAAGKPCYKKGHVKGSFGSDGIGPGAGLPIPTRGRLGKLGYRYRKGKELRNLVCETREGAGT